MAPLKLSRVQTHALLLGLVWPLACGDHTFPVPEPEIGEAVCMLAVSSGHWDDGRSQVILDEDLSLHAAGCACLPPEDRHAWSDEQLDMLAELTLAECEDMAQREFDFDSNDCRADFEAEAWYQHVFYVGPEGNTQNYMPDDLYCVESS